MYTLRSRGRSRAPPACCRAACPAWPTKGSPWASSSAPGRLADEQPVGARDRPRQAPPACACGTGRRRCSASTSAAKSAHSSAAMRARRGSMDAPLPFAARLAGHRIGRLRRPRAKRRRASARAASSPSSSACRHASASLQDRAARIAPTRAASPAHPRARRRGCPPGSRPRRRAIGAKALPLVERDGGDVADAHFEEYLLGAGGRAAPTNAAQQRRGRAPARRASGTTETLRICASPGRQHQHAVGDDAALALADQAR